MHSGNNIDADLKAAKSVIPTVNDVLAHAKRRYVEAANRNMPELVMDEVAGIMASPEGIGDRFDQPLYAVLIAYGLHEAAKTARQHGNFHQADQYHGLGQCILEILAEDVGFLVGAVAHFGAVKH